MKKESGIFKMMIFIQMTLVMSIFYIAASMEFDSWNVDNWSMKMLEITIIHALGTYTALIIAMYLIYTKTNLFKLN